MALTTKIALGFDCRLTKPLDLSNPGDNLQISRTIILADGDGADEADVLFHDRRSLADGADETLDLHDGTLTDSLGTAVTMDILKALYIRNTSTDASLQIGGAATTPLGLFADASDILSLPPGGVFLFTAPNAAGVDVTTNSDLKLAHSGAGTSDLVYEIIAIGVD